jgi:hypothetical protein
VRRSRSRVATSFPDCCRRHRHRCGTPG